MHEKHWKLYDCRLEPSAASLQALTDESERVRVPHGATNPGRLTCQVVPEPMDFRTTWHVSRPIYMPCSSQDTPNA